MSAMTEDIEAREKAALPGPWEWTKTEEYVKDGIRWGGDKVIMAPHQIVLEACGGEGAGGAWGAVVVEEADAQFAAHAREDIPYLLALLRDREEKLEALERERDRLSKRLKAGGTVDSTALVRDNLDRILKGGE